MSRPLLFLDFDDVICINEVYGGYDVAAPNPPPDLWHKLWHAPALRVLKEVVDTSQPQVVLTTSWLLFMRVDEAKTLLRRTGVPWLAEKLHPMGEALQRPGWTRLEAIDAWMAEHWRGEPYAILDDWHSGTGLAASAHDVQGRVVLCEVNVGLLPQQASLLKRALAS